MENQSAPTPYGVPESFYNKFGQQVTHVLSGFDRIRFRGSLRMLFDPRKMDLYLGCCGVLLKEFGSFAQGITTRVKQFAHQAAQQAGRPMSYLAGGNHSKEELARELARRDKISSGLITIFTALEPCLSYSIRGDRWAKKLKLVLETRKCLHLYHYYLHPSFGLMHVRVQSWFPFTVDICLNGREWLARQLDQAGIAYEQRDNCFVQVADPIRAQTLLNEQLCTNWSQQLDELLAQAHPLHAEIAQPMAQRYYWSATQSEFATDICFKDGASLAKYYSQFLHHAIRSFASPDVLRFLGKRVNETTGKVAANFHGQVTTSLKHRAEGIRIRHSLNGNWLKMYDKEGQVLRVETTINHPEQFKVYRATESDPEQKLCWHRLRLGVADLWRRAQICEAANSRYLEALASVTGKSPLHQEALGVCRAIFVQGKRYRALNPWTAEDGRLLEAISRGEFALGGLRNRDLRSLLYPAKATSKVQQRRQAAAITRRLALLRAHGVLRKVGGTHRYQLSPRGRRVLTALLAARNADVDQLTKIAA
jgi:hypothetical protein